MQVTARIGGFLLLFVLVTAYLVRGGDVCAAGNCKLSILERKAATQTMSENKMTGGRRMGLNYDFKLMKTTKEIDVVARKSRILESREDYRAGFVAFNADYKGPRHHPPKNN